MVKPPSSTGYGTLETGGAYWDGAVEVGKYWLGPEDGVLTLYVDDVTPLLNEPGRTDEGGGAW